MVGPELRGREWDEMGQKEDQAPRFWENSNRVGRGRVRPECIDTDNASSLTRLV